ncbi:MAG: hypothetical protein PUC41_00685 [Oscillospiraceae bacterium]|nr:hypothetical protein [Oscillospiraceae bacterium]
MKRPIQYLLSVVLTLLLVFTTAGSVALGILQFRGLDATTCKQILAEKNLDARVLENLTAYYTEQINTSGIPAEVYTKSLSVEQIKGIIAQSIDNAFGYLHGTQDSVAVDADFSLLEENLTAFFKQYAEENGYQQDKAFEKSLQTAIDNAKTNVLTTADVFRFQTLYEAKVLTKLRPYVPWVGRGMLICIASSVILLALLALLHRKELKTLLYWAASALFTASLLMLVPAAVIHFSRWFDRFAVKADQIFVAVTSYLYDLTASVMIAGSVGIAIAIALWVGFWLLRRQKTV